MKQKEIFETYESEVRSYCRNFPAVFATAKGSIMTDEDGNSFIDFFNGAGALNYGHNNDYIKGKVIEYLMGDGILHGLDLMTSPKAQLIEFMQEKILQPRGYEYKLMFPGPTGTNCVEMALKLARKATGRRTVWALMGAFHGMTLGSLALTSDVASRRGGGVSLDDVVHMPAPYMFPELDTVMYMETLLLDDHSAIEKPAAIILETTQAEGGIHVLPTEYLQKVRSFCDRYDIKLIVDDIQVGCARTGRFFSFERAGIVPDIVCLSKSIGGIGLPFAINLIKPEMDVFNPGEHNGTFRGNQLAMVAAKAGMEFMLEAKVEEGVAEREEIIRTFLEENMAGIGRVIRGIGCIWGIDVGAGVRSKGVIRECFDRGLILERAGRDDSVVKIMPSLVIEKELLIQGLQILKESMDTVLKE